MGKKKKKSEAKKPAPKPQAKQQAKEPPPGIPRDGFRETVESIVIAFVLAFLVRTFEAEAFVIPTGSMGPTLWGRNKDLECPQCGHRFTVSASGEVDPRTNRKVDDIVICKCPMCRYPIDVGPHNPQTNTRLWSQVDSEPCRGYRPTSTWDTDEILIDEYELAVPAGRVPGEMYALIVGFYDWKTLERLAVLDTTGRPVSDHLVLEQYVFQPQ